MGKSSSFLYQVSQHHFPANFKGFFYFLPISLALTTFLLIFLYISTTGNVTNDHAQTTLYLETLPSKSSVSSLFDQTIPMIPFENNDNDDLFADPSRVGRLARANQWFLGNLFGLTNGMGCLGLQFIYSYFSTQFLKYYITFDTYFFVFIQF